jgi:hypothetical protein
LFKIESEASHSSQICRLRGTGIDAIKKLQRVYKFVKKLPIKKEQANPLAMSKGLKELQSLLHPDVDRKIPSGNFINRTRKSEKVLPTQETLLPAAFHKRKPPP